MEQIFHVGVATSDTIKKCIDDCRARRREYGNNLVDRNER